MQQILSVFLEFVNQKCFFLNVLKRIFPRNDIFQLLVKKQSLNYKKRLPFLLKILNLRSISVIVEIKLESIMNSLGDQECQKLQTLLN